MGGMRPDSFLHRLNPLSKVLATTPLLVLLAMTTGIYAPLAFILVSTLLLLALGGVSPARLLRLMTPLLILVLALVLLYPLIVRRELVQESPLLVALGPLRIYTRSIELGLATGLRILAMILLTLVFSLTTDATDFVRALVQQWRLPYRLGYGLLAALRFAPMLQSELVLIRAAHRVRGINDEGGLRTRLAQLQHYAIPLLATAIRRAERTALAMDSRAFGAFPQRTYFRQMHFAPQDYLFVFLCWSISAIIFIGLWRAGLLGPLVLIRSI
jgi:energy-coupling factor transport system permease protein